MDMTGERRIPAPREVVWQALNDPAVLKASIPGCESLEKISDNQMKATASVKIGPISARFTGNVQLTDIDPPNGYNIGGEGQGGVAGFAKGGAKVALADDAGATLLRYEVHAQVGGKIAQLGARLIDATAKQMADAFFTRFSAQVEGAGAQPEPQALLATPEMATASSGAAAPMSAGGVMHGSSAPRPVSPSSASPAPPPGASASPAMPVASAHPPLSPRNAAAGNTAAQAASSQAAGSQSAGSQSAGSQSAASQSAAAQAGPPEPAAAGRVPPPQPPAAISMLSLIPPEPFGLPIAFWLGSGVFAFVLLLVLVF